MTARGIVRNGVVELAPGVTLPEGAEVDIELAAPQPVSDLARMLVSLAGTVDPTGLPPDLADNHDHYIHGAPKEW